MRKHILPAHYFESDVDYYAQFEDGDCRDALGDDFPDEVALDFEDRDCEYWASNCYRRG
nr:MAG TPA: hypothetical protein [Caudoviricetes sp.]